MPNLTDQLISLQKPVGLADWQWTDTKVQLVLLLLGYKKAISANLDASDPNSSDVLTQLFKMCTDLGLICEQGSDSQYQWLNIALNREDLNNLKRVLAGSLPEKEADKIHGSLSGFPETAIAAYISGDLIDPNELPGKILSSPEYIFGAFRYSRQHWQDELKTGQIWAEAIKAESAELYEEYLKVFS